MRASRYVLYVLIGLSVLFTPLVASAHTKVERSIPSAGEKLMNAPREVVVWSRDPLVVRFSLVTVLDASGVFVSERPAISRDRRQVTVAVRNLPPGNYTVNWRLISAIDGHTTWGGFTFTLQEPSQASRVLKASRARKGSNARTVARAYVLAPALKPVDQPPPNAVANTLLGVLRWSGFLAAFVLVGGAAFEAWVLRPGMAALRSDSKWLSGEASTRLRAMTVDTAAGLLLILAVEALYGAAGLIDATVPRLVAAGALSDYLLETRPGWSIVFQGSSALLFLFAPSPAGRTAHPSARPLAVAWMPPVVGALLLSGFALASHAARNGPLGVIADWTHLLVASVWIGGLASLLVVLSAVPRADRSEVARALVPRFSTVAGISLCALLLTGAFMTSLEVPALQALTATFYGRALLVKILLFAPLAVLGALNRFFLVPRIRRAASTPILQSFLWMAKAEVILGGLVLAVVAVLVATPPANVTTYTASAVPDAGPSVGTESVTATTRPVAPQRARWSARQASFAPARCPARPTSATSVPRPPSARAGRCGRY